MTITDVSKKTSTILKDFNLMSLAIYYTYVTIDDIDTYTR